MRQAIIILAHRDYLQIKNLINYFEGTCDIFIHIDKGGQLTKKEIMMLSQLPGVHAVKSKYKVHWGGFSILKTEIYMMDIVLKKSTPSYIHLLSGQDYPIRPLHDFLSFFANTTMDGFCSCVPMTDNETEISAYDKLQYYVLTDYINGKTIKGNEAIWKFVGWQRKKGIKRRIPDCFNSIYQGSAWFSFRKNVVEYIISYTKTHPSFYRRMRFTYVPEETYITTIALNSPYRLTRHNNCRIISWKYPGLDPSPIDMKLSEFPLLFTSRKAFFARKISLPQSQEVIDAITQHLLTEQHESFAWDTCYLWAYNYDEGLSSKLIELTLKLKITSVCDFGCGPGWYVACLRDKGVSAIGYDINPHTSELSVLMCGGRDENCCATADLSESVDAGCRFDLVMALSVGECIQPEREAVFIDNLRRHAAKYLIVSWNDRADDPSVVNPQPQSRIIERICGPDREFCYNEVATGLLREASSLKIHKKHLMVFQRI